MRTADIMTTPVVTVTPETNVQEVARLLLDNRISAVPVVDGEGRVVGMLSEGDLMRRAETGTDDRHSWWLSLTRKVVSVSEDASLEEVATLLERHRIGVGA